MSIAAHVVLVLSLVVGTRQAVMDAEWSDQSIIETAIRVLLPPDTKGAPSASERAQWATRRSGASQESPFAVPNGTPVPDKTGGQALQDTDGNAPISLAESAIAQDAFTLLDVDSAATRDPGSVAPSYPKLLEAQGVEGVAVVRFVIDTTGRADLESFQLMETNHPLFGESVRSALPGMKFIPATIGARRVRQLVELPFAFRLVHVAEQAKARKP